MVTEVSIRLKLTLYGYSGTSTLINNMLQSEQKLDILECEETGNKLWVLAFKLIGLKPWRNINYQPKTTYTLRTHQSHHNSQTYYNSKKCNKNK